MDFVSVGHLTARCSLALLMAVLSTGVGRADEIQEPGQHLEYEVKAAFLFNFVKFVEWPERSFPEPASPIRICVFGDDVFAGLVEKVVRGETLNQRNLVVHRTSLDSAIDCHVLFVSKTVERQFPVILERMQNAAVLTVGEHESFSTSGGILNFYLADGKVRFEVNMQALGASPIKISSRLLRLARIARPSKQERN